MIENAAGIIGGIGSMSSAYFYERVIALTDAAGDSGHINMIILNHADIPDRTAFICGKSAASPLPFLVEDARLLERSGAGFVAVICNTAHYFYDEIASSVGIPVLNMVAGAVSAAVKRFPGMKKLGLLATDGTVAGGVYARACEKAGIECVTPDKEVQAQTMSLIYDTVKAGKTAPDGELEGIIRHMRQKGCECIVLACTELSLAKAAAGIADGDVVDALEALAEETVIRAGKKIKNETRENAEEA